MSAGILTLLLTDPVLLVRTGRDREQTAYQKVKCQLRRAITADWPSVPVQSVKASDGRHGDFRPIRPVWQFAHHADAVQGLSPPAARGGRRLRARMTAAPTGVLRRVRLRHRAWPGRIRRRNCFDGDVHALFSVWLQRSDRAAF